MLRRFSTVPALLAIAASSLMLSSASTGRAAAAGPRSTAASAPARNSCSTCLERAPLLDPSRFAKGFDPQVKLAYEAARRYPDTIDRIHCFCECKESAREHHKTLLTCFTNEHAAGCGIC
jgi:hypothetical protein